MGAAVVILIAFALMIPLTAIILDSPVVRAWVERMHGHENSTRMNEAWIFIV